MPTTVLDLLTREELLSIVDASQLQPEARRSKAKLVEAVVAGGVHLSSSLEALSRERLKELCREAGLGVGGSKIELIERLTGERLAFTNPPEPLVVRKSKSAVLTVAEDTSLVIWGEKLTVDRLSRYLWSAADILRRSIDSSDYKGYIFGFLFLKRLSDRFDEVAEQVRAEGGRPEDKDEHEVFVPKRARWSEIKKVATNVGETLNTAVAALEEANGQLEGVMAGVDFNDERRLGDTKNRDVVLGKLVQHFAKLDLRNANLSEPDMLGRAYEYLIEKFADDAGKKGGEFYTPRMVVRLIVDEAKLSEDPAVELLEALGFSYVKPEALEAERGSLRETEAQPFALAWSSSGTKRRGGPSASSAGINNTRRSTRRSNAQPRPRERRTAAVWSGTRRGLARA